MAYSGKFVLRLRASLHASLRAEAQEKGLSLNTLCVQKLQSPVEEGPLAAVVHRARKHFPSGMIGIVIYGSWARGQATLSSDIDVLIVMTPGTPITRGLYHDWDLDQTLVLEEHPVELVLTSLPSAGDAPTGFWAEIALDGIIIWEEGFALSRHLGWIRHQIASGLLSRHFVHGQPYWIYKGKGVA